MDIASFLNDNFLVLPKTYKKAEDFRKFVYRLLDEFVEKLNTIHKSNMQFDNIDFSMDSIIARQKHLVSYIKKALDYYYDGKPAKAYQSLVDGLESNVKDYSTILNIRSFPANSNFYRLRVWKDNYPLPSDEFFHIPFDKRGKVKTQRFSIPGFPSLYLGTTVYVCWEELNRPNINEFQAVRLKNIQDIKVIDLSPPKNEVHSSYDYYRFLMIWPLVLASSVKVRDYEDTFKPEYIIPQLLLQWVREKSDIDGIAYQTTHINFVESLSKGEFLNLVLPVREIKSRGLCNILKQKFEMTNAASLQLEQCSTGGVNWGHGYDDGRPLDNVIPMIELIKGRPFPYSYSVFGDFERTLGYMGTEKIK